MRVLEKVGGGALLPATDGLLRYFIGASCHTGWRTVHLRITGLIAASPIESEYDKSACDLKSIRAAEQPKGVVTR